MLRRTSRSRSPLPRVATTTTATSHARRRYRTSVLPYKYVCSCRKLRTFKTTRPRSSPGAETRTRRPIANRPRPTSQPTPAHCALWRRPAPGHPPPKGRVPKTASSVEWSLQALKQACSQEYPESAMCVQSLDDSLDSAIRITYRISLRSSSMWEPRHPSLKVVLNSVCPRRKSRRNSR